MELPNVKTCFNTSDDNLDKELYEPCLKWAIRFDRGVGYFTSGWLTKNAHGMASFAERGGKARWVTSPILDPDDFEIIRTAISNTELASYFHGILLSQADKLADEIEAETMNALAWMIYDGIIEMRFAVPTKKLSGDFHDKFGIFYDDGGNYLSINGSINDSAKGFSNYEGTKVFKSWTGMAEYALYDIHRFEKIWNSLDQNLLVMKMDDAIKNKLIRLRKQERPYKRFTNELSDKRWEHQDKAVEAFLTNEHGILEMATGTGKTRTAIKIIKQLFALNKVSRVIITMYGNDLLQQWVKECLSNFEQDIRVFKYFDTRFKELSSFLLCEKKSILIISRDADRLSECLNRIQTRIPDAYDHTLFIFDEVHGFGANSYRSALSGRISTFRYRLGLSATPEREYDEEGNNFIEEEVGPIIFRFGLEDAIRKGILCELTYFPLEYALTDEEKQKKRSIIGSYEARRARGELVNNEDMYRDLARVNKTSVSKLPLFNSFVEEHPEILERCLIFVETKEYGELVQQILISHCPIYHTYYGEDDSEKLEKFASGELNCLVTCKKISEGIDIKTVKNIVLFSSDRSRLVTTQRIGRSLRIDPSDPLKRANIVDYICPNAEDSDMNADSERRDWLIGLSEVRREDI